MTAPGHSGTGCAISNHPTEGDYRGRAVLNSVNDC